MTTVHCPLNVNLAHAAFNDIGAFGSIAFGFSRAFNETRPPSRDMAGMPVALEPASEPMTEEELAQFSRDLVHKILDEVVIHVQNLQQSAIVHFHSARWGGNVPSGPNEDADMAGLQGGAPQMDGGRGDLAPPREVLVQSCADCGAPSEETDNYCEMCWEHICKNCEHQCLVCRKYMCRICRYVGEDCCREGQLCPMPQIEHSPHCRSGTVWAGPRCICTYPLPALRYMQNQSIQRCEICTLWHYRGIRCNECNLWVCVHCRDGIWCKHCRRVECCKCRDQVPWRFVRHCQTCGIQTKWCRHCQVEYQSCDECNSPWACEMCGDAVIANEYKDCPRCRLRICTSCQGCDTRCVGCMVDEGIPQLAINATDWGQAARAAATAEDERFETHFRTT